MHAFLGLAVLASTMAWCQGAERYAENIAKHCTVIPAGTLQFTTDVVVSLVDGNSETAQKQFLIVSILDSEAPIAASDFKAMLKTNFNKLAANLPKGVLSVDYLGYAQISSRACHVVYAINRYNGPVLMSIKLAKVSGTWLATGFSSDDDMETQARVLSITKRIDDPILIKDYEAEAER